MNEMATSMIIALINILILAGISFKFLGVAVTFKLLNVVLLFAIGGYLFVKHLLPFIKGDILSKKQTQKKMKENAHNLDLERKDLLEDIEQQKDCIKSLDLKLSASYLIKQSSMYYNNIIMFALLSFDLLLNFNITNIEDYYYILMMNHP